MLVPAYEAKKYEDKIYKKWEESGAFKADSKSDKKPFTISMPPPNATGTLHLGHAVMLAIEDILIRHRRMKGFEALWLPGTDHAAIATESVVIKNLKEQEGIKDPRSLGREKLVQLIAEYVAKSQNIIRSQIRKMGASCDWSRERYTMNPSLNRCVNEVFKKMYEDGLIYRAERVVNWDVALQTTISDDEIEYEDKEALLYTFEYLSAKQTGGEPVYVSTSRPETKLGDTALAVNPDDNRYKHLINKHFEVPWPDGHQITVSVIADHQVNPEFGTGVVGITPFHSKTDYELWQRHKDKIKAYPIQVIGEDGKIMTHIKGYAGMSITAAREKFVEGLKKENRFKSEAKYTQPLSISYRSKKPIEPLPKMQWFIDVNKRAVFWKNKKMSLKEVMHEVVKNGQVKIIPAHFEKTYFHWIDNLQDWCISRQIWWGHRVPVWYKGDETFAGLTPPKEIGWEQDEDTLDTWFSSALWTWSTLVDPAITGDITLSLEEILKKSADFEKFHPTSVMETGYDILFFWIARMILMTTYATGQIPFETVYLHGLIRTREGKKMSKSDPSTCIDPLDMIEKYGADALRMSMVIGNTPGNDMCLYEEKIKGYRNFTNKLWNASRYVLGVLEHVGKGADSSSSPSASLQNDTLTDADQWILEKLNETIRRADKGLMDFKISETAQVLYDFLWNDFCDWYLELSKCEKQNPAVLYHVLKNILILLHPFVPFVTEAIWTNLPVQNEMLINQNYPKSDGKNYAGNQISKIISVISCVRHLRAENKIDPAAKIPVTIYGHDNLETLKQNQNDICRLARISELTLEKQGEKIPQAAADMVSGIEIFIPLTGLVDTEKEKIRLKKEIEDLEKYVIGLQSKLQNQDFISNAPKNVVEGEKTKLTEAEAKMLKLKQQLSSLQ